MKKKLLLISIMCSVIYTGFSQGVGIGTATPDASAALDITSNSKGVLIPRMNINSINAIVSPARGLLVYDSVANQLMVNIGTSVAPNWQPVASNGNGAAGWNLTGNNGTNPANQFVGTTDKKALRFRVNNIQSGELNPVNGNILFGLRSGEANTSGFSNIAIGTDALKFDKEGANLVAIGDSALFNNGKDNPVPGALAVSNTAIGSKSLFSNTIGSANTATGTNSLFSNTDGTANAAYGVGSLFSNTRGVSNTAIGGSSLSSNTTGNNNTAAGFQALFSNTTGVFNSAFGSFALDANTTGNNNTATGFASLNFNTIGEDNTATGIRSLFSNTVGNGNTANGKSSLFSNTTGGGNTAVGNSSLFSNTIGGFNTATGHLALFSNTTGESNSAYGSFSLQANTDGAGNAAFGSGTLFSNTTGSVNTAMGDLSLNQNTTGRDNTAVGVQSLFLNSTGNFNTAIGGNTLGSTPLSSNNIAIGFNAAFDFDLGSNNTIIGVDADADRNGVSNATAIGAGAIVNASNKVRIGNAAVTVIEGQVPFTTPSDGRFKYKIKEDVKGLDFIMQLRPVTYQFDVKRFDAQQKHAGDDINSSFIIQASYDEAAAIRRTGFIAQEVEKAANASGYDFSGIIKPKTEQDHYSLSYESFVVPLVKAVQEQQQVIQEQQQIIKTQQQIVEELKLQNADLQKRVLALEKK